MHIKIRILTICTFPPKQRTGGALAPMNKQKWCFAEYHAGGNTDLILRLLPALVVVSGVFTWCEVLADNTAEVNVA